MNGSFVRRFLVPIVVLAVISAIILIYIFSGVTWVPFALYPPFADLITITYSVDCVRAGFDPYTVTAFDPWQRTFNYPKVWLVLFDALNWTRSVTNPLGIIMAYLFAAGAAFLFRPKKLTDALLILLLVLSPPVLLLLERANCDIFIFLLVTCGVFYIRKASFIGDSLKLHLCYLMILAAGILKIYPIVVLPLLLFEKISRRDFILIAVYTALIFGAYLACTYPDLAMVSRNTPRPNTIAYGKNVLLQTYLGSWKLALVSNLLIAGIAGLAVYINLRWKAQLSNMIPVTPASNANIMLFIAGGLLYSGTFFIGNHYDYRLVHTLLLIPFLIDIFRHSRDRRIAIAIPAMLFFLLYGSFLDRVNKYAEVLKWASGWGICFVVFIVLFYLLIHRHEVKRSHTGL